MIAIKQVVEETKTVSAWKRGFVCRQKKPSTLILISFVRHSRGKGGDKLPYIKQEVRKELDPILQELWLALKGEVIEPDYSIRPRTLDEMKGLVNYCFTKILVSMLNFYGTRYHNLSSIHGVVVDAGDEFARIFMAPYEDKKRKESGEVKPLS